MGSLTGGKIMHGWNRRQMIAIGTDRTQGDLAMRLAKLAGVVAVAGALAGCSVGFPITKSEIGSPPPDAARLIVYRPSGPMLMWRSFNVDVNGGPTCDLPRGSGFAKDVASGEVTVAVSLWQTPGDSKLSWKVETGKTYYLRVRVSGETSPGVKGGLIGLGSDAPPGDSGLFDLDLTDETTAIASGVELRHATSKMAC
jgi:hypothetical protein